VDALPYRLRAAEFDLDLEFLRQLYASTRQDELAVTGWPQPQIDAFLAQQFNAQHQHYISNFAGADFDLILDADDKPIGRLYLEERDDEFRIIDIALLCDARGKGIGGSILRRIIQRASDARKPVRIHVEATNRAKELYLRLGFQTVEDHGVYQLMECNPQG
jgi:ribosomal protein S18 acetylase RimI-like enzyme